MEYVLIGLLPPLFWAIVFWLTRHFAPYLNTPVGVAWREYRLRRRERKQASASAS